MALNLFWLVAATYLLVLLPLHSRLVKLARLKERQALAIKMATGQSQDSRLFVAAVWSVALAKQTEFADLLATCLGCLVAWLLTRLFRRIDVSRET